MRLKQGDNDLESIEINSNDTFVIDFDNKAFISVTIGFVTFITIYIFLSDQIKNTMKGYILNNNFGIGVTLVFFLSAFLYFLISETLGKKRANGKYEFLNKYIWIKNLIYLILFASHLSLGILLANIFVMN